MRMTDADASPHATDVLLEETAQTSARQRGHVAQSAHCFSDLAETRTTWTVVSPAPPIFKAAAIVRTGRVENPVVAGRCGLRSGLRNAYRPLPERGWDALWGCRRWGR